MTDLAGWAQVAVVIVTISFAVIASFWKLHADQRKQDYQLHLRINALNDEINRLRVDVVQLMADHNKENAKWRESVESRLAHIEAMVNGKNR